MVNDKLYYLASPYSRYPHGIQRAHDDVVAQAVFLNEQGIDVFSPIAHSHYMTFVEVESKDYYKMLNWDAKFIARMDGLIVCMLDDWATSTGVRWEIDYAKEHGKPVYYMLPNRLPDGLNVSK